MEPEITENNTGKRKIAFEVFLQTWKDFYTWEKTVTETSLKNLQVTNVSEPALLVEYDYNGQEFDPDLMDSGENESFTVEHYDEQGNCIRYTTLLSDHYPIMDWIAPYPKYEICTPASQNHTPATNLYDTMAAFVPYVDDPEFPASDYLDHFETFSWQEDFDDPDLELIQLEAVRRLHVYKDFSYEEIDDLRIFPTLRKSQARGLLWGAAQRDIPWQGLNDYLEQGPTLPKYPVLDTPDLFAKINQDLPDFCPNLNCLRTFCPTHRPHKYPLVDPVKPKLTSTELRSSKGKPCGEDCFRLIEEEDLSDDVFWGNQDDVTTLESILKLMPDQSPCDLAVICRKPCHEVFEYRCILLPDEGITDELYQEERPSRFIMPQFTDLTEESSNDLVETPTFAPLYPCYHKGPCDQNSTCPCYMEGQHCQRNCRCTFECSIRWRGCDCTPTINGIACKSKEDCICHQVGRECDPEVCTGCDARYNHIPYRGKTKHKPPCRNVDLQRGITKGYIVVSRGSYGLGAFARASIKAEVVIGEYIAEVFPSHYVPHREPLFEYTGLNYGFDLNAYMILDSTCLGNDTRYLNDARPYGKEGEQQNNCESRIRFVNGDHRVAIITKEPVEAGQELLLDYGPKYWVHYDGD